MRWAARSLTSPPLQSRAAALTWLTSWPSWVPVLTRSRHPTTLSSSPSLTCLSLVFSPTLASSSLCSTSLLSSSSLAVLWLLIPLLKLALIWTRFSNLKRSQGVDGPILHKVRIPLLPNSEISLRITTARILHLLSIHPHICKLLTTPSPPLISLLRLSKLPTYLTSQALLESISVKFPLKREDTVQAARASPKYGPLSSLTTRSLSLAKGSAVVSASAADSCTSNSPPITNSTTSALSILPSLLAFSDSLSYTWGFCFNSPSVRSSSTSIQSRKKKNFLSFGKASWQTSGWLSSRCCSLFLLCSCSPSLSVLHPISRSKSAVPLLLTNLNWFWREPRREPAVDSPVEWFYFWVRLRSAVCTWLRSPMWLILRWAGTGWWAARSRLWLTACSSNCSLLLPSACWACFSSGARLNARCGS